jgi:hypothetical protein
MHVTAPPSACLAALLIGHSVAVSAEPAATNWTLGLVGARAVDSNLGDLLPKLVKGELVTKNAELTGLLLRRSLEPPATWRRWADANGRVVSNGVELGLYKGSGLVSNTELTLDWRPAIRPWPGQSLDVEFAWGIGVSHSFGQAWTDMRNPPSGYRTLLHMAPELVLKPTALPDWSLALRIHHRSGAYGLIGPKHLGSNHAALVLAHDF